MMNYEYFATREQARQEAAKMRESGWPSAVAVQIVTDTGNRWVVRAWQNETGNAGYLRDNGFVES